MNTFSVLSTVPAPSTRPRASPGARASRCPSLATVSHRPRLTRRREAGSHQKLTQSPEQALGGSVASKDLFPGADRSSGCSCNKATGHGLGVSRCVQSWGQGGHGAEA